MLVSRMLHFAVTETEYAITYKGPFVPNFILCVP
jgi:hypothetical protein